MKTAVEEEVYGAVNMTANERMEFQVRLSDPETEATAWSRADIDRISSHLEREIYGITANEWKRFKQGLSIDLIGFEACWQAISVQQLRNTVEQRVFHFRYPKMPLVSHISESIWRMGSGDNFTTDISGRLNIGNME